jgi:hypothetical protein
MGDMLQETVEKTAGLIAGAKRIVVFTGAGVSTESGIPDFRSPGGIWSRFDPEEFTIYRFLASAETRLKQWKLLIESGLIVNAKPNRAHLAVADPRLVDTLLLARRKHPGVSNRLDDLCSRYAIDNSRRTKHGALLDAELLAEVYIDLIGARQSQLILASETRVTVSNGFGETPRRQREVPLAPRITEADREAHRAFIATLGDKPIWNDFLGAA